ncbi:MAG: xylulokinase, partial [Promethearchaeota archaeon]
MDHGTSGFKNGLTNLKAEIIDFEFEPTPIYLFDNGGAEQDPDEWWSAFLKSAKRLLGRNRDKSDKILAFSVSGQWACTVAVDREGKSLMNAISWMDSRGAPYIQKLLRDKLINISGYGLSKLRKWIKKTGGGPGLAGKDPISHILYIKNEFPDIYEKTYKFLDSKDYINLKLTGKFAATYDSVHINWITDIRDPYHIKYDQKLMKILGVEPDKFPELIYSTDVLGTIKPELASELGVSKGIKVMGGTPDLHAVLIGSGGLKDFQSVVYIGTSSFLLTHVPFKRTDVFHNLASIPSAIPGKYFAASEQETAGACLNFLLDNILRKPIIK